LTVARQSQEDAATAGAGEEALAKVADRVAQKVAGAVRQEQRRAEERGRGAIPRMPPCCGCNQLSHEAE
jgi:hypothetical protein